MTAAEALAAAAAEGLTLLRADMGIRRPSRQNVTGFNCVSRRSSASKPFKANLWRDGRTKHLGVFATAEEAALAVARFLGPGAAVESSSGAHVVQAEADSDNDDSPTPPVADDEALAVEAVSDDDDDAPPPPAPAPPVLCYCERPAALLDGRWVCAQLVEGDFCILGREDE